MAATALVLGVLAFGMLAAAAGGVIVYVVVRRSGVAGEKGASGPDEFLSAVRIPLGPGKGFEFSIVGEASYLGRLKRIAAGRLQRGETVVLPLVVVPEPTNRYDRNAIRVVCEGSGTVGYFSREDAEEWKDVAQKLASRS